MIPGINEEPSGTHFTASEESADQDEIELEMIEPKKDAFVESFKDKVMSFKKDKRRQEASNKPTTLQQTEFKDPNLEPVAV